MLQNDEGQTLKQTLDQIIDPEETARLNEICERLRVLRKPRTGDPWNFAFPDGDPEDYRNQRIATEITDLEDEADRIRMVQVSRLRQKLETGSFVAFGYPADGRERVKIDADLWPVLTKIDFRTSAASNPKTGRRFDQVRVCDGPTSAKSNSGADFTPLEQVAVDCIRALWRGPPPPGLKAKERDERIRETAKELGRSSPGERTIRKALSKLRPR